MVQLICGKLLRPPQSFFKSHCSLFFSFVFGEVSELESFSTGAEELTEAQPSFSLFFCFILRFWNQIFTCVSFRSRLAATSTRRARVRYLLKWNSFSSSVSCLVVKLVRITLCWPGTPNSDWTAVGRNGWMDGGEKHGTHGAEVWGIDMSEKCENEQKNISGQNDLSELFKTLWLYCQLTGFYARFIGVMGSLNGTFFCSNVHNKPVLGGFLFTFIQSKVLEASSTCSKSFSLHWGGNLA